MNKLSLLQEELAKLLGVYFSFINRCETGKHEPTKKHKRQIVELCKKIALIGGKIIWQKKQKKKKK